MNIEKMNKELKEENRKSRNKRIISIAVVLFVVCVGVYWIMPKSFEMGASGAFEREKVEESAGQVIELLNEDDFEGLIEISTEKMQGSIRTGAIESVREEISKDWGECISIGEESYMTEVKQKGKHMAAIQKVVSYKNVDVIYTISFDKEMKLAGLHITEKAEPETENQE